MRGATTPAGALLEEYRKGGWSYVTDLPNQGAVEGLHLDFKRKADDSKGKMDGADNKNLSKALSGFANADGGLVVWGVDASPGPSGIDKVQAIRPIDDVERFASDLRSKTPHLVSSPVEGVNHEVILKSKGTDRGVVLTLIPKSDAAPHMATASGLRRYYRRTSTAIKPMEHYEIADMFGRRPQPKLKVKIGNRVRVSGTSGGRTRGELRVKFVLRNEGKSIAHHPMFSLGEPQRWSPKQHLPQHSRGLRKASAPGGWWRRWVGQPGQIVYPEDELDVEELSFNIDHGRHEYPDLRIRYKAIAESCPPIEDVHVVEGDWVEQEWEKLRD